MRIVLISIFCFLLPIAKAGAQINLCDTVVVLRYEPIPVAVAPGHFINGYEIQVADVNYHVTINKQKKIEFQYLFHFSTESYLPSKNQGVQREKSYYHFSFL